MQAAFVVGMVFGAIMTLAASFVVVKDRNIGLPVLGFTMLGVVLIGMSVWSQVKVQINEQGLSLEVLRSQVEETSLAVQAIAEEVSVAAEALEVNQAQFNELATTLVQERVISRENLRLFVRPPAEMPTIDRAKLDTARIRLDRVIQAQSTRREFQ